MFARVEVGVVAEVIIPPDGVTIEEMFHPDLAAQIMPCPGGVAQGWLFDGEEFTQPEPLVAPIDLLAYAADRRWQIETGGITAAGLAIATDDRSKLMLAGARIKAQADESFTTTWFGADGSATQLDAGQIVAISDAVLDHVDRCFSRFAAIRAAIAEDEIGSREEIDAAFAAEAWPA
jgi:hypothetical protein